jgi:hypothetical protein
MGYFRGSQLQRKIQEYDLADLDQVLANIANDTDNHWPVGGYIIEAQPALLEPTRIVLYSMLHSHHLKTQFTVRINYDEAAVYIDMKGTVGQCIRQIRQGAVRMAGSATSDSGTHNYYTPPPPPTAPVQQDDFSFLADDSTTLNEPAPPEEEQK